MNKRLCITGGSGFIGTCAVDYAIAQGFEVLSIDIQHPKKFEHQGYWRNVDIRDAIAFSDTLNAFNPTHILHLAATTGMDVLDISFFDANTKGVENLIQSCAHLPALKRVVFTSSLLVCKNGYIPKSDEEYCPPNLYGESKVIGEKLVRQSVFPCSWTIVRPTSIWGPWFEHSYRTFFKMVDRGFYFQPGASPIVKPLSFVGNTVYMMFSLLLSENSTVNGQTYYLGDYPETSIQKWADLIRKNLGKGKTPIFPLSIMKLLAKGGDVCKKLGWKDPPITSFRLNNMLTGAHYPIEITQKVVGPLPFTLEDGVQKTISWMSEQKLLRNIPTFH